MDGKPASPGRLDTGPVSARRRRRFRASVAFWVTVSISLVGVAATSGNGNAVPDLDFRQVGHWVYSASLGKVFHVNGASKSVDAAGDVEGGRLAGGPAVQGPGSVFVPGEGGTTIEFGKSRLRVKAKLPTGVNEPPFPLEPPGGPYYVYRQSGIVQRLSPLVTIRLDGSLADPVATPDGTVWLLRTTDGALCSIRRDATAATCAGRAPAGHEGALTVLGGRPAFVDTTSAEVRWATADGLGEAMPLGTRLGKDAKVGAADAQGRLPIVRPSDRTLLLVDTTRLAPGRTPPAPRVVPLPSAEVSTPVSAGRSIALVDAGNDKLITYDLEGKPVVSNPLPAGATVRLIRGDDGRVYVEVEGPQDGAAVIDADGRIVDVPLTDPVPGTDPSRPASPAPSAPPPPQDPTTSSPPAPTLPPEQPSPSPTSTPTATATPTADPTEVPDPTTGTPEPPGLPDPSQPPRPTATSGTPTAPATTNAPTSTSPRPPGGGGTTAPATAPGAPRDVRAVVEGTGATVSWTPGPANGSAVTAYLVSWRTAAEGTLIRTATLPATARLSAIDGLTPDVAYVAAVAAENRAGRSLATESNPVTPVIAGPGAPANVGAAADGTDGSVTVTFDAVAGATAYVVTASNRATLRTGTTDATFPSLPLGGRFTFTVAAVDAQGRTGPASAPSNSAVPWRAAAAPTGLQATRGDGAVSLAWAAPVLNGGELTGYQVTATGLPTRTVTGRATTISGLTAGQRYEFTVRAVTREQGGDGTTQPGAVSAPVAITAATVPVVDVVSAALAGGTLTVVADVADGGAPMTTCQVRVGAQSFPAVACAAGRRTLTVGTGAIQGTPTVTAVGTNQVGTGQPGRGAAMTGGASACENPADVLDLGGWSLGLPGSTVTDLGSYSKDPEFVTTADCEGVRFRAAVGQPTTSGSEYPRTALRNTTTFSSTSGTHTLTVSGTVTRQPNGTPAVVVAQVHGADDDLATFRLQGGTMYVSEGDENTAHTAGGGAVGSAFTVRFVVSDGSIKAYYNGGLVTTIDGDFSGAYFQAGAFTQANCDNSSPCDLSNYGEVVISGLSVSHG